MLWLVISKDAKDVKSNKTLGNIIKIKKELLPDMYSAACDRITVSHVVSSL